MVPLKFVMILLLSLGYAIWAEWLDLYHAIVGGIPFTVLFLILILLEVKRARDAEEEGEEEDERTPLPTIFAAVLLTAIVLAIVTGAVWLVDTKTDFSATFYDTDRATLMKEIEIRKQDGNWAKIEEIIAERLAKQTISKTWFRELAEIGYEAILKQGDAIPDEEWKRKKEMYEHAEAWAITKGLKPGEAQGKIALVKTPTLVPTLTPTPRPTATPTRTPTLFPTPSPKLGANNPCAIPPGPTKEVQTITIALTGESNRLPATAGGKFFELPVLVTITGDEKEVCISSTTNGRGYVKVDDIMRVWITQGGRIVSDRHNLSFYDPTTTGITPEGLPSQSIKWLFPKTPGEYAVVVRLDDKDPPVWSTTQLILVIW